jgi:hypothetical protein
MTQSLGTFPFLVLFILVIELFPQSIEIIKDFEGGNIEVISIDSSNNIISVTPEYKNNDTHASYFYFKVKGFNKSQPLKIKLYTDEPYYATEMIAYSTNLSEWNRIQAMHFSGYNEFTRIINSDSVYFAIGYPYVYSDMINLVNSIEASPFTDVTDLTFSENGRAVKLIKITDPNVNDSSKYLAWIIARQHAFETHSNYVIQGLINYVISDDYSARRLREQAILYFVPVMDVDNAYNGGTGKDQLPVDFNRDWDSPSYWNAVNAVKQKIAETSSLNNFQFFIDSHNPWPSNVNTQHRLYFYTIYNSGPRSYNINFYRDIFEEKSNYQIGREPMYSTNGQTSKAYVDSMYEIGFNVSMETGWVKRPDDSLWTIERYERNGAFLGQAMSEYINNLPQSGDIIIDNTDTNFVSITGNWVSSTFIEGFYGQNYIHDNNSDKGSKSVTFTPVLSENGFYEVFLRWTSDPGRDSAVTIIIQHADGTTDIQINQKKKGAGWVSLGTFPFEIASQQNVTISNQSTTQYVIADAVRFRKKLEGPNTIETQFSSPIANGYRLSDNFPNPFNPTTRIRYTLAKEGNVTLKIFNYLGQEAKTIVNTFKEAGTYEVRFTAEGLSSGIYFYKLSVNGFSSIKKMVLMK